MVAKKKTPKRAAGPRSEVKAIVGRDAASRRLLAGAIAREAGKKLYRIDLGKLINKYIGETEKALAAALARAETTDVFSPRESSRAAPDRHSRKW